MPPVALRSRAAQRQDRASYNRGLLGPQRYLDNRHSAEPNLARQDPQPLPSLVSNGRWRLMKEAGDRLPCHLIHHNILEVGEGDRVLSHVANADLESYHVAR